MGEIAGRVCKKTAFEDFIEKLEGKRRDGRRGEETGGRRRGGRRAKARQRRANKTKSRDAPDGKPGESESGQNSRTSRTEARWKETSKSWCKVEPSHPKKGDVSNGSAPRKEGRRVRDIHEISWGFADVRGESACAETPVRVARTGTQVRKFCK